MTVCGAVWPKIQKCLNFHTYAPMGPPVPLCKSLSQSSPGLNAGEGSLPATPTPAKPAKRKASFTSWTGGPAMRSSQVPIILCIRD